MKIVLLYDGKVNLLYWFNLVDCPFSQDWTNPILNYGISSTEGKRGGSVAEGRTPEREVGGWKPTSAVLCP